MLKTFLDETEHNFDRYRVVNQVQQSSPVAAYALASYWTIADRLEFLLNSINRLNAYIEAMEDEGQRLIQDQERHMTVACRAHALSLVRPFQSARAWDSYVPSDYQNSPIVSPSGESASSSSSGSADQPIEITDSDEE